MCGIAGILKFNNEPVTVQELKSMTDIIIHRGPDGEGQWINQKLNIGLGHRRLSIIDLSENAKQPMHYANCRYSITFNGEIYNYIELKEGLKKKGFTFNSDSDTEVLLALYHFKKEECLQDIDGMFAFAIWDEVEQVLFCARDRFGEKPFHYYYDNNKFVFASEIKQFWQAGIEKNINSEKLLNYIQNGIIDEENNITKTFYKNILRLDAAHYLRITSGNTISINKYWSINTSTPVFLGTIECAAENFLDLFKNSIRLRLRSDVPVGSSLSGGLDSSSIVMLIDALKGNEIKQNTFSARFKGFAKDEGKHIEEVVKACKNVLVHYTWPDKDYFEKAFNKVTYHQDEPYGSASIVAQYAVMEIAKQNNVTVLLDGQGADEQLGGYSPYYKLYLDELFLYNQRLFKTEFKAYQAFHQESNNYTPITETLRMKLGRYRRKLLNQPLPYKNNLKNALTQHTTHCGLKELLRYADRNSMAHSREVRLPFLSHKLVEFIFSLPDEYKLNNGWTKFILRKAMDNILPNSICWRVDKIGYEPPQNDWLKNEKYKTEIDRVVKALEINVNEISLNSTSNNMDWRLLMGGNYI
ncbi:MAG: asparagine synthase (glutamine-hydrolyzing) [Bacteroidetes bacterium]|nr:asparagine synthase (glutamine-hydrolyzing) [Bacteroidota bacterium]